MPTVYKVTTGEPVEVVHAIDARSYVEGGAYTWNAPEKPKPAAIPTVEDKKPAEEKPVIKDEKPTEDLVVVKEEPIEEKEPKPTARKPIATPKKSSRIVRK